MATATARHRTPQFIDWRSRYDVLDTIGSGGSATVYEAFDRELSRPVALKVIEERRGLTARVAREVQAAAALGHPGIVQVYDFFTDGQLSFIVCELVDGQPLDRLVGELDDSDAVEAAAQLLEALAHAHAQGIVHRDVKPQNVMLTESGRIKVMDFGIARLAGVETLTAEGDMLGTVAYMSPEQAGGKRVGPATDVYSAAVVLFELLSGENPTPGDTPGERLSNIVAGRLLQLRQLRPDLPEALLDAVSAALSLQPARRPSAADMAQMLREVLAGGQLGRRRGATGPLSRRQALVERLGGTALAALTMWMLLGWLPAYPASWRVPLVILAAAVWAVTPSGGLAFLAGTLVFPFFNVSLVVGAVYLLAAIASLLLARHRPLTALWPVLAVALIPLHAVFLVPLAAAAFGRVRGPLAAVWAGLGASFVLTLGGVVASPFTLFAPSTDAAARIISADGFVGALTAVATELFAPQGLLQAAVWAAVAGTTTLMCTAADRLRRLWVWSFTFAGLFCAYAFLPPLVLGRGVVLRELLLTTAVVAVVALLVVLPGLPGARSAAARRHRRLNEAAGDAHGVQEA